MGFPVTRREWGNHPLWGAPVGHWLAGQHRKSPTKSQPCSTCGKTKSAVPDMIASLGSDHHLGGHSGLKPNLP